MNIRAEELEPLRIRAATIVLAQERDFRLGELKVRPSRLQVQRDGENAAAVTVEPRVMQVIVALAQARGEVVGRSELIDRCWSGRIVGDNAINRVISHIRRLEATFFNGSFQVETIPRVGYRLNVARPLSASTEASSFDRHARGDDPALDAAGLPPVPGVGRVAADRRRWISVALAAGAAVGLAGAGWWTSRRPVAAPAPSAARITLAVLPFRPLAEEGRDKLLEAGMADSLIARLSTVPGLAVRSTGSALRFSGQDQDPIAAARELDVAWIVDGSLQRSGERLRTSARLLRVADGVAAWSGSFDERYTDVFDMQDQIAERVMQALGPVLGDRLASETRTHGEIGGTQSADAYQLYLAAMWRAQGQRPDDITQALRLLDEALVLDPAYALAWVGLAWTHRRSLWIDAQPSSAFEPADAALARALAIAPTLAEARAGVGYSAYWFGYDWAKGEREFRAALAANPNIATAHYGLAQLLLTQDRIDEGIYHMRTTCELDPMSPVFNAIEASFLLDLGRIAEADTRLRRALAIAPNLWLSHVVQGMLLIRQERPDEALAALHRAAELGGASSRPHAVLGARLAATGQRDEARQILARLQARADTHFVPPTSVAAVHAALGEADAALTLLERAYRVRDTRLIYLKDDPHWRGLREEPRFVALMKKLGLDGFGRGLSPV